MVVATNIGVHFFDLLIWLFGNVDKSIVHLSQTDKMSGFLSLQGADVKWFLSLDKNDLPEEGSNNNRSTFRSIKLMERSLNLQMVLQNYIQKFMKKY